MKLFRKHVFLVIAFFVAINVQTVSAKLKNTPIYIYGFAASFNDSIVYFTEIQEIADASIDIKNKFLYGRDAYSYQLKTYLQNIGREYPTCITAFATSKKAIEKKYLKMRKKYINKGSHNIQYIKASDFKYTKINIETSPASQQ